MLPDLTQEILLFGLCTFRTMLHIGEGSRKDAVPGFQISAQLIEYSEPAGVKLRLIFGHILVVEAP